MNGENEREMRTEEPEVVQQQVADISEEAVKTAMRNIKVGVTVGPDNLLAEAWKCLGELGVKYLTKIFNQLLEGEGMPGEWRNTLVLIYKNKDVQCCGNCRGIRLRGHTMKLWERVVEHRIRVIVEICEKHYGFMP